MNLFIRFLSLIFKRILFLRKIEPFDICKTPFWVNPLDLDANLHMNNGRYLSIMDLGRIDLMIRSGVMSKLMRNGYYPVVASESIRFRKSLEPFRSFVLATQIESWDEKDFYMSQTFLVNDDIYAHGYLKARFKQYGRKGSVPTSEIFELMNLTYEGPRLSELAHAQSNIESKLALHKT